jgi:two-component system chemotaxis response regulator CheB
MGASLGGMRALSIVLSELDESYPIPIAVVLHRHALSGDMVQRQLRESVRLAVREPEDKQPIERGIFVAPADYHLLVEPGWFTFSLDAPESYARPSVDALFQSAADAYGAGVQGVVLTGTNQDGALGTAAIGKQGGSVIAQEPNGAEAGAMPQAAIAAGADLVLPLEAIGAHLRSLEPVTNS